MKLDKKLAEAIVGLEPLPVLQVFRNTFSRGSG